MATASRIADTIARIMTIGKVNVKTRRAVRCGTMAAMVANENAQTTAIPDVIKRITELNVGQPPCNVYSYTGFPTSFSMKMRSGKVLDGRKNGRLAGTELPIKLTHHRVHVNNNVPVIYIAHFPISICHFYTTPHHDTKFITLYSQKVYTIHGKSLPFVSVRLNRKKKH